MTESAQHALDVPPGSNRSFGLLFTAVFFLISLLPLLEGGELRVWSAVIALAFLSAALLRPSLLAELNRAWYKLGLLMHKVVNPIAMAVVYFLAVTPTGIISRILGGNHLQIRFDKNAKTYWMSREKRESSVGRSLHDQF